MTYDDDTRDAVETNAFFSAQFGEDVSVAASVALVSERNSNQTAANPQLHPSVSGEQDPAAALWGSQLDYTRVRTDVTLALQYFVFRLLLVAQEAVI